jgi:hypothetical protein
MHFAILLELNEFSELTTKPFVGPGEAPTRPTNLFAAPPAPENNF